MYLQIVRRTALTATVNYTSMVVTTVLLSQEDPSEESPFTEGSVQLVERHFLYYQIFFIHTMSIVGGSFKRHGLYDILKKKATSLFKLPFSLMKLEESLTRQLNDGIAYGKIKRIL
jgi:hypothetical protein